MKAFIDKYNGGEVDTYLDEILAHNRWTLFNVIPFVSDYQTSSTYMKELQSLGSLDHINTRKYRRYKMLPYRLFHYLENKKNNK
jgi:hypothetical protein